MLQAIRFDPAGASWQETGSPCAAVGYNDDAGMRRTPPPCRIGGFVAWAGSAAACCPPDAGHRASFLQSYGSAAIYDSDADAWLKQPKLPDKYWPGMCAEPRTDGTALVVGGQAGKRQDIRTQFVPPR